MHDELRNDCGALMKSDTFIISVHKKCAQLCVQYGGECIHVVHRRGPTAGEADNGVAVVVFLPEAIGDVSVELRQNAVFRDDEDLVCRRVECQSKAVAREDFTQLIGRFYGRLADFAV